jgi:hypothetical protein
LKSGHHIFADLNCLARERRRRKGQLRKGLQKGRQRVLREVWRMGRWLKEWQEMLLEVYRKRPRRHQRKE